MLTANALSHSYDGKHFVLADLNIHFQQGQSYAILGPSGCGKTTLLSILSGFLTPSSGDVKYQDRRLSELSEMETSLIRNQDFGFVFQQSHFIPEKTVLENILLPLSYGVSTDDLSVAKQRAYDLLEKMGLTAKADASPTQLSGGEQQRVSFIRAIIQVPSVVFADEPTGALDKENAGLLMEQLLDYANSGKVVIIVTHNDQVANACNHQITLEVQ